MPPPPSPSPCAPPDAAGVEFFGKIHHWFPIFDEAQFRQDVDSFYKDSEALANDRAWHTCFNNVLLFGLHNQLATMTPAEKKHMDPSDRRVSQFFFNAWSAIDDLEVFIAPRLRNIQALMTAVSRSQPARLPQSQPPLHSLTNPPVHLRDRSLETWYFLPAIQCTKCRLADHDRQASAGPSSRRPPARQKRSASTARARPPSCSPRRRWKSANTSSGTSISWTSA